MSDFTIYNQEGRILRSGFCPEDMVELQIQEEGEFAIKQPSDCLTDYVDTSIPEIKPREVNPIALDKLTLVADGIDKISITNSSTGTFTAINVYTGDYIEGEIVGNDEFSTTIPGQYLLSVVSYPFLNYKVYIDAI